MRHDAVPTALPDEPTHMVVWETVDQQTVRVHFADPLEASDGIPQCIETERSATVAVVLTDLDEAFELIGQLARRDRIGLDVMKMPGPTGAGVLGLLVNGWRKFRGWFPNAVKEAEPYLVRSMGLRKATAVMFRLHALAREFGLQLPPNGHDFFAIRVE